VLLVASLKIGNLCLLTILIPETELVASHREDWGTGSGGGGGGGGEPPRMVPYGGLESG